MVAPDVTRVEKNWIPLVYSNRLAGIYRLYPLVLVSMDQDKKFEKLPVPKQTLSAQMAHVMEDMRGSSTLVPFEKNLIGVFHKKVFAHGYGNYVHYLIEFS